MFKQLREINLKNTPQFITEETEEIQRVINYCIIRDLFRTDDESKREVALRVALRSFNQDRFVHSKQKFLQMSELNGTKICMMIAKVDDAIIPEFLQEFEIVNKLADKKLIVTIFKNI